MMKIFKDTISMFALISKRAPERKSIAKKPSYPLYRQGSFGHPSTLNNPSCACGGVCPKCRLDQIRISHPQDREEKEAADVANKVVGTGSDSMDLSNEKWSASSLENGTEIPSTGKPLDYSIRPFMESRLRGDLGAVRIHADTEADNAASAFNANAFTLGRDIYFARGHYQPSTHAGQKLLAHELTHVRQQTKNANARSTVIHRQDVNGANPPPTPAMPAVLRRLLDRARANPRDFESMMMGLLFSHNPHQAFFDDLTSANILSNADALQLQGMSQNELALIVNEFMAITQDHLNADQGFGTRFLENQQLWRDIERHLTTAGIDQATLDRYLIESIVVEERFLMGVGLNFAQSTFPNDLARRAFESEAAQSFYQLLGQNLRNNAEERYLRDADFRRRVDEERLRRQTPRPRRETPNPLIPDDAEVPT